MHLLSQPLQGGIIEDLADENDRAVAIVGATIVDYSLARAMLAHMGKVSNTYIEKTFDGRGPLATFSARIEVSFGFNVIGPKTRDDLNHIKQIRNDFAHKLTGGLTFDTPDINMRCSQLHLIDNFAYPIYATIPVTKNTPRLRYLHTISLLATQLEGELVQTNLSTAIRA